uniref:Uncharacterized protein n=1 Tax=Anguilla anguilla TaxID=7936 RepID=A0A0E9Q083_ANGAN
MSLLPAAEWTYCGCSCPTHLR